MDTEVSVKNRDKRFSERSVKQHYAAEFIPRLCSAFQQKAQTFKRGTVLIQGLRASGGMAYTTDLKSVGRKVVRVRLPSCPIKICLSF